MPAPEADATPPNSIEEPRPSDTASRKARAAAVLSAPVEPLLVDTVQAAAACGIGRATWFRLRARGMTPAPVKLAGRVLYRVEDLRLWVLLGCPPRKEFEARRAAANTNGRR
jgi:hypothetical protein